MHRDMPVVFFAALPERWRLFFILLAHSGMRVGEALGLTWRNVHRGDDPYLAIREQIYNGERKGLKSSHSDRRIPLSPKLARELQRWYEASEFTAPGDPVFPNSEGGPLNSVGRRTANGPPRLDPHPEGAVFGIGVPCAETGRQFGPSAWKTWL
jgi:integrase